MTAKAPNARTAKASLIKRVQALLTQANDKGVTEEEAQAFAAKAAELMQRYALDEAMLRAEEGKKPEAIKVVRFEISGQGWHGKGRAQCAAQVAVAYGCEIVFENNVANGEDRWVHVVGTASAIAALELLLPSILLQAETRGRAAATAYLKTIKGVYDTQQEANRARRVFFRSYLAAFGMGVGEKIRGFRNDLAEEVAETSGALVLASDAERVKAKFDQLYPSDKLGKVKRDNFSAAGATAGRQDGRTADTGQTRVNGNKKAVTAKKAPAKKPSTTRRTAKK